MPLHPHACGATGAGPDTAFSSNAREWIGRTGGFSGAYVEQVQSVFAGFASDPAEEKTRTEDVVTAIWHAATDPTGPMRIPAGADAVALFRN